MKQTFAASLLMVARLASGDHAACAAPPSRRLSLASCAAGTQEQRLAVETTALRGRRWYLRPAVPRAMYYIRNVSGPALRGRRLLAQVVIFEIEAPGARAGDKRLRQGALGLKRVVQIVRDPFIEELF